MSTDATQSGAGKKGWFYGFKLYFIINHEVEPCRESNSV
ncbi:transposase [Pseudoalteromonas luteoviolacea]|nr:transposase [Pseudoalteromonas luteoviolacea]